MSEIIENKFEDNQNTVWGELKSVPFNNKESVAERKFVKLEDLEPVFNVKETCIFGHGTASAGDGHDVVGSILANGLMGFQSLGSMVSESKNLDETVGSTDLSDNTVPVYSFEEEQGTGDIEKLREKLNHWKHRDAKNIILIRLPFKYFNMHSEYQTEKDSPFFIQKRDSSGQMRNYLDPRFIIGNYNRETGLVEMNEQFEDKMSDEFQKEMNQRLIEAEEKTDARHNLQDSYSFRLSTAESNMSSEIDPYDNSDDTWADENWE